MEKETLGQRMKALAVSRGISAYKIAEALGVWHTTIYNWWKDRNPPSQAALREYARFLGVSMNEITEGIQSPARQDQIAAEAAEVLRDILRQTAAGEDPEVAFDEVVGEESDALTPEDRQALAASPGAVRRYINRLAGGDFASLQPDQQLDIVLRLMRERDTG